MRTLISKIIFIALMQCCAGTLFAHVELDNPLGGETFIVGQTVIIQWHIAIPHNTLNWDVLFSSDGGTSWAFIQMDLPANALSYTWVVPSTITSQARVSVIQDNSGQDYQDESMNFTIQQPPMFPFIVSGAMDTLIESDINNQEYAIETWLDNHGGASASGFCGELIWSNDYITLSNECGVTGSSLVTFTAADECGSTETTATVTVVDSSPPVLNNPSADLIAECDGSGNLTELSSWLNSHGGAQASDDGGNVTWTHDYSGFNNECGLTGNATVIFTGTDECGNTATTSATFTVEDHLAPVITIGAQDTLIECGLPNTPSVLQNWLLHDGGAQASDLCGGITWTNDFPIVVDTCHASTSITVNFTAVDECGNIVTTSAVVTLMGTLGTSAPALSGFEFTVSPNPAHDQLKVVMDKAESLFVHLILFNVFGHQILSIREVTGEINVDVTGIAPGLYLVHARSNKGAYTLKVIVE